MKVAEEVYDFFQGSNRAGFQSLIVVALGCVDWIRMRSLPEQYHIRSLIDAICLPCTHLSPWACTLR